MDADKQVAASKLTDSNRLFIYKLTYEKSESGSPLTVFEAYQRAGYKGDIHAAYQLKSRLEKELMLEEINRGASKADIFKQIADAMALPAVDKSGAPVTGISMTNKLKVLALALKAHEQLEPVQPKITAFQINLGGAEPPKEAVIVEAEIISDTAKGE